MSETPFTILVVLSAANMLFFLINDDIKFAATSIWLLLLGILMSLAGSW